MKWFRRVFDLIQANILPHKCVLIFLPLKQLESSLEIRTTQLYAINGINRQEVFVFCFF